uniref:ADAM10 endopeptidase n=1 Tax=Astatotilapia calliptera TaxID=8154 RepID=A0A3P8NE71_ASTCA
FKIRNVSSASGLTLWCAVSSISPYIKYYEGLSYDREDLHRRHLRAKRATQSQDYTLHLNFTAFHRTFHLLLRQNSAVFSKDFTLVSENDSTYVDLFHIYSGILEGEPASACHGSVLQGQFEGTIHTENGTYHIEPSDRYTSSPADHHSIIYREDDMGKTASTSMKRLSCTQTSSASGVRVPVMLTVQDICAFAIQMIHHDLNFLLNSREIPVVLALTVVSQVASYIRAVNDIYDKVDFSGIQLINFKVKSLRVMTEEDKNDPLSPLYIGPEKLLSLYSENNWGNFCLSYLLTDRDYSGVLGLAWEGKAGNWGGVCSKPATLKNGVNCTLNTGLVTIQNYGQFLPPRRVQLTLAHELGHSLGSPHDEGANCGNLDSDVGKGRYLMFPYATDGARENNDKFSPCSIKHVSNILKLKKDDCFTVSDQPICGNQIIEEGEECDVGNKDTDLCCYSAKEPVGIQCHLKPGKICSPSQGLCCGQKCEFKPEGQRCDEETDCQKASVCSGLSPLCPKPAAKENLTVCSQGTRVCLNGVCTGSVCVKHHLEKCDCPGDSMREKCHMCCQKPDQPETCASTTSSVLSDHFHKKVLPLVGGAPCSGNRGYCDKFHVCRILDADGPIARLKNSFLHLDDFDDVGEWMKVESTLVLSTRSSSTLLVEVYLLICMSL